MIKGLEYQAGNGEFSYMPVMFDKGAWIPCDGAYDVFDMFHAMVHGNSAKLEQMLADWDDVALNQVLPKLAEGEPGEIVSRNVHGVSFTFRATTSDGQ
tara:strand:+ start:103 stop:396 length:294 start_codon:yes stop_codon:yes gene_type:complete